MVFYTVVKLKQFLVVFSSVVKMKQCLVVFFKCGCNKTVFGR